MGTKDQADKLRKGRIIRSNWGCDVQSAIPSAIRPRASSANARKASIGMIVPEASFKDWSYDVINEIQKLSSMTIGKLTFAQELMLLEVQKRQQDDMNKMRDVAELLCSDLKRIVEDLRQSYRSRTSQNRMKVNDSEDDEDEDSDEDDEGDGQEANDMLDDKGEGDLEDEVQDGQSEQIDQSHNKDEQRAITDLSSMVKIKKEPTNGIFRTSTARPDGTQSPTRQTVKRSANHKAALHLKHRAKVLRLRADAMRLKQEAAKRKAEAYELEAQMAMAEAKQMV